MELPRERDIREGCTYLGDVTLAWHRVIVSENSKGKICSFELFFK